MNIDALIERAARPLRRRVDTMVMRGVVALANAATKLQTIQVKIRSDEVPDGMEFFESYGHTAIPLKGAEALVLHVMGRGDHAIVIATPDRRYRPNGLVAGESALYDDQGQRITIYRDRIEVEGPRVVVKSNDVEVGDNATQAAVLGDLLNTYLTTILSVPTAVGPSGPATVGLSAELSTKVKMA